jgi:hypothetical protein
VLQNVVVLEFGVDKVERVGTYTRLSWVGIDEEPQVPGITATEWEPVATATVVSRAGVPLV